MKKFLMLLASVGLLAGLSGCKKDDPTPNGPDDDPSGVTSVSFKATADESLITATSATIFIDAENVQQFAYIFNPEEEPESPAVIFATGVVETMSGKQTYLVFDDLEPVTSYTVYFAAQVDESTYYNDIVEVSFVTNDINDDFAVYGVTQNSFSIRVNLPEETAKRVVSGESAIRSATYDLFTYNTLIGWNMNDASMLADAGQDAYYPDNIHTTASFTRVFDEAHMHPTGEGWDSGDPEESFYYYPIVPGQPNIVLLGEYAYHAPEYEGDFTGYLDPSPYFDQDAYNNDFLSGNLEPAADSRFFKTEQGKYWSGYYRRAGVMIEAPKPFDAGVKAIPHITPIGGSIEINPDPAVYQYVFTLLDQSLLDMLMPLLNNNEDLLQWFITSFPGYNAIAVYTANSPAEIYLDDVFYEVNPGDVVSLFVVSMGDEYGSSQNYQRFDYTIPVSTKPAPEIVVTPINNPSGEEDPYEVWFNIKSVGSEPVYKLYYAANDKDSWEALLTYSDYDEVLDYYGNSFSAAELPDDIAAINSADGLNVSFWSRDGETTILAAKAMNDEGVMSKAVSAENTTIQLDIPPVESDLYTTLQGDWTITIPVTATTGGGIIWDDEAGEFVEAPVETLNFELTGKVTVGDVDYPATLPSKVYDIYSRFGYSKETVDEYFDQFKESVDAFNDNTKRRNRILMNGFPGNLDWDGNLSEELEYASPYDLFSSPNYNGATVNSIVADFGPKWYLQVNADGSVTVPVNFYLNPKLTGWSGASWYMMVSNFEDQRAFAALDQYGTIEVPVEISDDRNTITIKPYVYNDTEFRLSCAQYYGDLTYIAETYDDIVLTRGWTAAQTTRTAALKSTKKLQEHSVGGPVVKVRSMTLDRTPMPVAGRVVKRTVIKPKHLTEEQFNANVQKYIEGVRRGFSK